MRFKTAQERGVSMTDSKLCEVAKEIARDGYMNDFLDSYNTVKKVCKAEAIAHGLYEGKLREQVYVYKGLLEERANSIEEYSTEEVLKALD